jgi:hypothetical protein
MEVRVAEVRVKELLEEGAGVVGHLGRKSDAG